MCSKFKKYFGFDSVNAPAYLGQGLAAAVSLQLSARGPYAMREVDELYNVTFSDGDRQVTYKSWQSFQFDPAASCAACKATDVFTAMNPGLLTAMATAGSELIIGLSASNADLSYGTTPACTPANIQHSLNPAGACDPTTDAKCCCVNELTGADNTCTVRARKVRGRPAAMVFLGLAREHLGFFAHECSWIIARAPGFCTRVLLDWRAG